MDVIKLKGLDEEIYYTVSKDGLPIYIWKNDYVKSFYISLNVKYGSIHTDFQVGSKKYRVPQGIAHFMEHIKFHVDKDKTANDIFDPLGSSINAFTTFKYTSYTVYGTNKFLDNLNNLLDYVFNPYFTKDIIKNERGIISSEINMMKDQPYNNLYFTFNKCIYKNEKFRELIAGEIEDIKKIELKDIELIYNTFYHPKNMFLIICGNVNPYEVEENVNKTLEKKDIGEYANPKIIKVKEPKYVYKREEVIKSKVEVAKAKIGIKIPIKEFKCQDRVKLNILLNILLNSNFGDTSDLKEEMLKNGLITYLDENRIVGEDYVIIDITIESKYIDEAIKRVEEKLANLEIDEDDFKRKINSAIATLVMNYEDSETVNNILQNYLINYGEIKEDLKNIYESLTMDEIVEVINSIDTKEMSVVKMIKE